MWYKNSYRRHLCDMHIDDWDEEFLSKFSPEEYFENLKKANTVVSLITKHIKTDIEYIRGVGMTINPMTLFILCQPRKALSHC